MSGIIWRSGIGGMLLGAALISSASAGEKVEVQVVNYEGLQRVVKDLKGRIIVVDFWQDTCIACKKEFPHLVEMQNKYRMQGLAAVSVNLDDPNANGIMEKVRKFLTAKKAVFTNLILNEKPEAWEKKLQIQSLPTVIIFDREGKIAKRFPNPEKEEFNYSDVEKVVTEMLKK